MTSDADVETAKPNPDIVEIALPRAGVEADRAVFVGDTVWDAKASRRAQVPIVGVLSGGYPATNCWVQVRAWCSTTSASFPAGYPRRHSLH